MTQFLEGPTPSPLIRGEGGSNYAVFEKVFENIQVQGQQRLKNAKRSKNSQKVETEFETDGHIEEGEFSASNEDERDNTYEERVAEISFQVTMNKRKTF